MKTCRRKQFRENKITRDISHGSASGYFRLPVECGEEENEYQSADAEANISCATLENSGV
jgi:hypothetical protein